MFKIAYTQHEHDLMDGLSLRQLLIMQKIARLIGIHAEETAAHAIPLADFIGKGYDDFDSRRILKKCMAMEAIIREASIKDDSLFLQFYPEALPIVRKMALQVRKRPLKGNGEAYCESILALKMALGIKSDVEFVWKHDHEDFNFGDDCSYMAPAFSNDSWRVSFKNKPVKGFRRIIEIWPVGKDKVQISQTLHSTMRGTDFRSSKCLGTIEAEAFIKPEEREKLIPGLVGLANELLENALNGRIF